MGSILPGYEYDIFISYRHNDNLDNWVTDFVEALEKELKSTLKNDVSIYFDKNPHDGLHETHLVNESLAKKLKCLVFIPIVSQTYCDIKSFAWEHEFLPFNTLARQDDLGMNITLSNGNVVTRILPIKIHHLDHDDQHALEAILDGTLRSIDFIYSEAGVNRPLNPNDKQEKNLNNTLYKNQINKVANALKDIGNSIVNKANGNSTIPASANLLPEEKPSLKRIAWFSLIVATIFIGGYFGFAEYQKYSSHEISEVIPETKSIAVLPFTNMSSDTEQNYFCDGIAEDILIALTQLQGLKVTARTSSFSFKNKDLDIREIGKRLGVASVLEGSVQKSGNKLRITAQLVNVDNGISLWSESYDREIEDIFLIKDEIAQNIVKALSLKLTNNELKKLENVKTQNVEAYDLYLRGREYFLKHHSKSVPFSIPFFEKAIEIDSNYALAYAGLTDSYIFSYMYINNDPKVLELALATSKKALELDSGLVETHTSRGIALSQNNQFEEAERQFNLALKKNPRNFGAHYEYARALKAKGMRNKSVEHFGLAAEIEPDNYLPILFLVSDYEGLGMMDKMKEANKKAISVFQNHIELYPDDSRALYLGAGSFVRDDQIEKALEWLQRAVLLDPTETAVLYNAACIYSKLGYQEKAIDFFSRAIDSGFSSSEWIKNDKDLDNIRNDPRYEEILSRIK
jgi:TolB-like protein